MPTSYTHGVHYPTLVLHGWFSLVRIKNNCLNSTFTPCAQMCCTEDHTTPLIHVNPTPFIWKSLIALWWNNKWQKLSALSQSQGSAAHNISEGPTRAVFACNSITMTRASWAVVWFTCSENSYFQVTFVLLLRNVSNNFSARSSWSTFRTSTVQSTTNMQIQDIVYEG